MKRRTWKKIALYTLSILTLLVIVLAVHIYIVTRPKAPDAGTKIMARFDIHEDITSQDAQKMVAWMYEQPGVDHVLYNPDSRILVFTFFPVRTNADRLAGEFRSALHIKADRIVATAEDLKTGCPVSSGSAGYKIARLFKRIF